MSEIKQPKFKFGDKLRSKKGNSFYVNIIRYSRVFETYEYMENEYAEPAFEELCEPDQEPQKKKLYAWANPVEDVRFTSEEQLRFFGDPKDNHWRRAPEYDIEYPPEQSKA